MDDPSAEAPAWAQELFGDEARFSNVRGVMMAQATWEMGGKGYGWEGLEEGPLPDPWRDEWADRRGHGGVKGGRPGLHHTSAAAAGGSSLLCQSG